MALITETNTQKTITKTIKTSEDFGQIIGTFTYTYDEKNSIGNVSSYIVNQESYKANEKEFKSLYTAFIIETMSIESENNN